jgi:hypothetical protein
VTSNAWNQLWYGLSNMHDLTHRINFLSLTAEIFNLLRKSNCAGADVSLFRRGRARKGQRGPRAKDDWCVGIGRFCVWVHDP